ncbi:MAG: hypothetical protein JOY99_02900 [Sphingomonadaceae bacterium]|nr:hypothetical protein [Sphingomonadaceae bacterium]
METFLGRQNSAETLPASSGGGSFAELLDHFESIGDSCEFGALQKLNGVDQMALFKWTEVPLACLAELIDADLAGVDAAENFDVRLEERRDAPFEYMIDHRLLQSPMHTFVKEGRFTAEEVKERERRRLAILRRKFLEDAAAARRIYVYRSLAPRDVGDVANVLRALRRLGPNRLLFVRPPDAEIAAAEVRIEAPGFAIGALDDLAIYEASTAIRSTMWPHLLRRALAALR